MYKVFIDGAHGTTGLRINEYLAGRPDIQILEIDPELRKETAARVSMIKEADVSILCLPDQASKEIAAAAPADSVIIDTSTAHRTDPDWIYGMPELTGQRELIKASKRIANPGCHAGGFIALVRPLVEKGILSPDIRLSCFSLTGYSGGGKKMIAEYEADGRDPLLDAPRIYALPQAHKHLPEMKKLSLLEHEPVFSPIVASYYSGMEVSVGVTRDVISGGIEDIKAVYKEYYNSGLIRYDDSTEGGFISASAFSGRDDMCVAVYGNDERITLISRFDNLGKGASGAAIQNMNICLGLPEDTGLVTA